MAYDRFASLKDITSATGEKSTYTTDASKLYGGVFGDSLFYPSDLGTAEANHYVIFFINELVAGKYKDKINSRLSKDSPVFMQRNSTAGVKILNDAGDAVKTVAKSAVDMAAKTFSIEDDINKGNSTIDLSTFAPDYKRTSVCIALPPPDAINTSFDTNWGMTTAESLNLLSAGADAFNTYQKEGLGSAVKQVAGRMGAQGISKFAANMLSQAGNLVTKSINNPRREMMFDGVMPRRFAFQWTLMARSPEEAKSIWDIIQMFKYHMLPEYDESTSGFFINFPNTFDIEYHSNGKRNNWLPKTSTCALTRVDLNYTPGGSFAFFKEIAEGAAKKYPDGAPTVGVTLSLDFAELETIYRNRIDSKGDYSFNAGQSSDGGTF